MNKHSFIFFSMINIILLYHDPICDLRALLCNSSPQRFLSQPYGNSPKCCFLSVIQQLLQRWFDDPTDVYRLHGRRVSARGSDQTLEASVSIESHSDFILPWTDVKSAADCGNWFCLELHLICPGTV